MKKIKIVIIGLLITGVSYSQTKKSIENRPKDMVFCPSGVLTILDKKDDHSTKKSISVNSFFISNEITNKEYRMFYDHVIQTPNDSIYWVDPETSNTTTKVETKTIVKRASHKDIISKLFDHSVWDSDPAWKDYFVNPKFDNYPVIGVTYEGARLYCIWRTNKENEQHEEKGEFLIENYRIPYDVEWEYAAASNNTDSNEVIMELHKVTKGEKTKTNIYNLQGNVSEWTASIDKLNSQYQVVRGGSWKGNAGIEFRELIEKDKSTDYLGFRIVRTTFGVKK